ncbi:MAG: NAD(P)H-dependent flavin oxidoreductase, partial [Alphaproteobacteria bacterium]
PNAGIAKKLVKSGIDALIIEGHEAGGHIGPVSTTVLVQEVLGTITDVPVFVAGGIGSRQAIAAYMAMGAAGCQLGTRFVCATESRAHPKFKAAFIHASARDAIVSTQLDKRFPVIPVRALKNQGMDDFVTFQRQVIEDV